MLIITICCISFDSYIKPQLVVSPSIFFGSCISFDSYIKPQLVLQVLRMKRVVYLLIPTSNHNHYEPFHTIRKVVYLLIPTSNHNRLTEIDNTTMLYIFWFLHQTTTTFAYVCPRSRCISFDSYIKPQLQVDTRRRPICCISFDSYIKPQLVWCTA